jgi:hypothetical protein
MSQITSPLSAAEIRGIKWVFRCSDVRLTGDVVEGYRPFVMLGVCGDWKPLGSVESVLRRVKATVAAHGGYCP